MADDLRTCFLILGAGETRPDLGGCGHLSRPLGFLPPWLQLSRPSWSYMGRGERRASAARAGLTRIH